MARFLALGLALGACGGKDPATAPAPIASATGVAVTPTPGPDTKAPPALPALPGLNMYARARDVKSLSDYAMKQANVPTSMLDAIGNMTFGSAAWSVIDLEAPAGALFIQPAESLSGEPTFTIAFSTDSAKVASELPKLKTSTKKSLRFFHGGKKSDKLVCALESITTKAYVLCSTTEDAIEELAPYLAPRLAAWDTKEQVSVFVPGDSWRTMVLQGYDKDREKEKERGKADDATAMAAMAMGRESLSDLGDLWFEGSLQKDGGLHGKMRVELSSEKSVVTRAYLSDSKRGNPLDAIKTMPSDVQLAFATRGGNAADLKDAKDGIRSLLTALMQSDSTVTENDVKTVTSVLDSLLLTGGPFALGWGVDPKAADKAATAFAKGKDTPSTRDAARAVTWGYWFGCVAEPQDKWVDGVKRFDTLIKEEKARKKDKSKDKKSDSDVTSEAGLGAPSAKLPAGNVHVYFKDTPKKPAAGGRATQHLFIAGRGDHTCGIVSHDESQAVSKLLALLDNTGDPITKTMPEVASFTPADGDVRSVFVSSVIGITRMNGHGDPQLWAKHAADGKEAAKLPSKGQKPFFVTDRVVAGKTARAFEIAASMSADSLIDTIAYMRARNDAPESMSCGGPGEPPCSAPMPPPPPPPPPRPRKK